MRKVLWIGPVINPEMVGEYTAVSPAANKWQNEFIQALINNNVEVLNISYIPERTWPFGRLWVNSKFSGVKNIKQLLVNYFNVFYLREYAIAFIIILKVLKNKKEKYEFLFTYNELLRNKIVALVLKKILKIKWVSILADGKTSGKADIVLFLSEDYFNRYRGKKYFLDGGLEELVECSQNNTDKYILYAGSMTKVTGIEEFIKIYLELDIENELHLYGKPTERIKYLVENHAKIKLKGFVDDKELHDACCKAFAFINPRGNVSEALNTFPSKLLLYLKYGKPIISYEYSGLSKKYKEVLYLYNSKNSLNDVIKKINGIDMVDYKRRLINLQRFNSWDFLVKRFIQYLEKNDFK